jgi:hypothetical protein
MKHLAFYFLLCLTALTTSNVEAFAQSRPMVVSFIPANSVVVMKVNWAQTRRDDHLKRIVRGDEFERIMRQCGIDSEQIAEWAVFGDINPTSAAGLGIILSGSFNSRTVADHLQAQGWSAQSFGTHQVYLNPVDNTYAAPLRPGLLVVGTRAGIEKVFNVEANPQTSITAKQPFSTLLADFARNPKPITFMLGIPQQYQAAADVAYKVATKLIDLSGLSPLGTILDKIGLARALGFSISRSGSVYPVELVGMMRDATTTQFISGALNLMKSLPMMASNGNMSQQDRDAVVAIQSMRISSSGTLLSISFNMPESGMPR